MNAFIALADPTRRQIVEDLAECGRMSASDIAARHRISKPGISQHLKVLKTAGLIEAETRAQFRLYRLNPAAMDDMADWIVRTRRMWSHSLQKLEELVKEDKHERS